MYTLHNVNVILNRVETKQSWGIRGEDRKTNYWTVYDQKSNDVLIFWKLMREDYKTEIQNKRVEDVEVETIVRVTVTVCVQTSSVGRVSS